MPSLADLRGKHVVALPDLFIDILVPLGPWAEARQRLDVIAAAGGGNVAVADMEVRLGGNALNLARALAGLGARADLIAETDDLGWTLLQDIPIGTERVRRGRGARTVALECGDANLMMSHAGPVGKVGAADLDERDRHMLKAADAVAVVNWSQNEAGTDLLREVADVMRAGAILFLDTGDPRQRIRDIPGLLQAVADAGVDAWSMNENEACIFGRDDDAIAAARQVAERTGVRVDLHTRTFAITMGEDEVRVPAHPEPARRLTGAGDHWNAGNLAGYLIGLEPTDRLQLAHSVATAHVT